mgnify:CR=1 FL=1
MNNQIGILNDWVFKGVSATDPLGETGPTVENCTNFKPGDYIVYKDAEYRYVWCEDGVIRWIKIDLTAPGDLNDMVYYVGKSTTDPESETGPTVIGFTIFHKGALVEYKGNEYMFDGENWKKIIVEDQDAEITDLLYKSQDADYIMGCKDSCDSCPSERGENWAVIEDMITDDLFPKEASVKIRHNKWARESELKEIPRINESNKAIVDKCLAEYKEKHPEKCKDQTDYDILAHNDDIWDKWLLYDMLVANSLRNNDFIITNWPEDGFKRGNEEKEKYHDIVRQFDVVFDVTLGGYVCQPYIVFNVCEKTTWLADQKTDDYAQKELDKIHKKYNNSNNWYTEGIKEYNAKEIELYKEGHINFDIRKLNPEYLQCIRKVTHKEKRKGVSHDMW